MFEELLARIARILDSHSLPYMIIGGQAVLLYGEPRLTRDIDVTLGIAADRLPALMSAVGDACFRPLPEDVPSFVESTMVLPVVDDASGVRVDFIFSFTPYEREAIGRARTIHVGGGDVRFAAVEDVVIHKVFAGRPRDLEDVRSILVKNPGMDRHYIANWLKEFDASRSEEEEGLSYLETFAEAAKEST